MQAPGLARSPPVTTGEPSDSRLWAVSRTARCTAAAEDGRAATITATTAPDGTATEHLTDAVDTALCR
ncbi:hypothetical protein EDD38_5629 [Kitasatospora cineracea]|uniref:Uncharacterized protein n=1 Tax=Kitasatospora cineracea TaxID=88074 RepID=A0A3N4R5Q5_9ACTN|nr:hypothetical protein EDD38_5629 [Kitasatospora cineracea]